jgi:RNA polymerase sigma-70 factor (ECF subfamily)
MVAIVSPALPEPSSHIAQSRSRSRLEAVYDANLVRRFKAGDDRAFAEIVTRHRAKMHQIALGLLRNHADAEEIAQDTFLRAYRALALFRGESSLATWLHRIAVNLSRNRYWYFHRRKQHVTQSLDSPVHGEHPGTFADLVACQQPGPVRETDHQEFSSLVAECMSQLTPSQQRILRLRTVQHCSYEEIGRTLGIATGTVKSRIARARVNLHRLLHPYYATNSVSKPTGANTWFDPTRMDGLVASR